MHQHKREKAPSNPEEKKVQKIIELFLSIAPTEKQYKWLQTNKNQLILWQKMGPAFIGVAFVTFCEVENPNDINNPLYFFATSKEAPAPPPSLESLNYSDKLKQIVYRLEAIKPSGKKYSPPNTRLIEQAFDQTNGWVDKHPIQRTDTEPDFHPLMDSQSSVGAYDETGSLEDSVWTSARDPQTIDKTLPMAPPDIPWPEKRSN